MSRSRKHTPICGMTTARSEKDDKQRANRLHRRLNKIKINQDKDPVDLRLVSDVWLMAKDGKQYLHKEEFRNIEMRKK